VDDNNDISFQQAQGDETRLIIAESVIFDSDDVAVENSSRICKIYRVFAAVSSPLSFIPDKLRHILL